VTTRIAIILPELLPVPPVHGGAVEHWVDEIVRRYPSDDVEITIFSRPAGVAGQPGVRYIGVPWTATEGVARPAWQPPSAQPAAEDPERLVLRATRGDTAGRL
jgi:hypothetical protein